MSNTAKELWDSFKGQLADRLANPFTGALVIAWCLFNFRLLVVLIWIEPYQQKFAYIDSDLYPTFWHWAMRAIVLPIIAAYGYLLFYPKVTIWAATRYRRAQSQANNEMRAAQGEALMTPEEYREARAKLARIESQVRADIDESTDRLKRQDEVIEIQKTKLQEEKNRADRLEAQLEKLGESQPKKSLSTLGGIIPSDQNRPNSSSSDSMQANPASQTASLLEKMADSVNKQSGYMSVLNSDVQKNLLRWLAKENNPLENLDLARRIGKPNVTIQYHMEAMNELDLVNYGKSEGGWYLTKEGRRFVVQNHLDEPESPKITL